MITSQIDIEHEVKTVSRIDAIPTMLEVICRTTGMGFAAVARVTEDKWVAYAVRDEIQFGLVPGGELKLETTICNEIRQSQKLVVIENVSEDETYYCHPTPAMYGFKSYISVPIMLKDGSFFGTLCAIHPRSVRINNTQTVGMFQLFAELFAFHFKAAEDLALSETKLKEERETAVLREQFIAILGHDLRNPVTAISNSGKILKSMELNEQSIPFVNIILTACYRMTGLIENILDFARGRLGEGITPNCQENGNMEFILRQVITELNVIWPERTIETQFALTKAVYCDTRRVAQLFSNLLTNALKYSKAGTCVRVRASSNDDGFILSVTNSSDQIPLEVKSRLFKPFSRGEVKAGTQGLGLGLYIASEIARSHGGTIHVDSSQEETTFTLSLPPIAK